MRVLPAATSSSSASKEQSNGDDGEGSKTARQAKGGGSGKGKVDGGKKTLVYLNVYDISPVNKYLYWFGLGIFHSGIEVYGIEYGFGAHENPRPGVFEVEPKSCPGFTFRHSLRLGSTDMSRAQFRTLMDDIVEDYHGDTYNLIFKNCNHFTDDLSMRLTGKSIPRWVNRLAKLGSLCTCVLPDSIKVNAMGDLPDYPFSDDEWGSNASIIDDSDIDELDHQLLTTPNSDIQPSRDKLLSLAKDVF